MVKALLDSNILIDFLQGIDVAKVELGRYEDPAVSIVSWIELLAGATAANEIRVREFLASFETIALDRDIAEEAALLRRTQRIKLPDAVIWASARTQGRLLVTRNTKDFPADDPGVRLPYRL
jgi:predicted nucleic acid-binding protein